MGFTKTDLWWFVRLPKGPSSGVYLPYDGTMNGIVMNRHIQDICGLTGGLVGIIYSTLLLRVDPVIFNKMATLLFLWYQGSAHEMTRRIRNMKGQIIIAFFGVENSLNTHYGDHFALYQPYSAQIGCLDQYRSCFFGMLSRCVYGKCVIRENYMVSDT